jgi:hypothetical protein
MEMSAVARTAPSEPPQGADSRPRKQVTLRGLFLATTYFAVSSGLAMKFGLGIFMLMNGVFLTWLSHRGYLWWMQTTSARPKTYGVAWLLFAVSFGLPAVTVRGCGTAPPEIWYGWQAAIATANVPAAILDDSVPLIRDPSQRTAKHFWELFASCILAVLWNLPNLLMLVSPLLLYRQQHGKGHVLSLLFSCAAFSSWTWGINGGSDLRIGYYVWSAGVTVIALANRPGRRSMVVLGIVLAIWIVVALNE